MEALHALSAKLAATEKRLMSAFTDLQDTVRAFIAAVEAMNVDINAKIAAAIAADDAEEDSALMALKDEVIAAQGKLTPPVV